MNYLSQTVRYNKDLMYFKSLWSIVLRKESRPAVYTKHYLRHTKPLKASARHHNRGGGQELLTAASVEPSGTRPAPNNQYGSRNIYRLFAPVGYH